MDRFAQLELHTEQLSTSVRRLMEHSHNVEPLEPPQADAETARELSTAKASILASIASIKVLVGGPDDLLQELATQVATPTLSPPQFPICHFRDMLSSVADKPCYSSS